MCEDQQHGQAARDAWFFWLSAAACVMLVIFIYNTRVFADWREAHVMRQLDQLLSAGKISGAQYEAARPSAENISVLEVMLSCVLVVVQSIVGLGVRLLVFLLVVSLGFGGQISAWRLAQACGVELPARMVYYYLFLIFKTEWLPQALKDGMAGMTAAGYGIAWDFLYIFSPTLLVIPLMCMLAGGGCRKFGKAGFQTGMAGCLCLIILRAISLLCSGFAMLIDWI